MWEQLGARALTPPLRVPLYQNNEPVLHQGKVPYRSLLRYLNYLTTIRDTHNEPRYRQHGVRTCFNPRLPLSGLRLLDVPGLNTDTRRHHFHCLTSFYNARTQKISVNCKEERRPSRHPSPRPKQPNQRRHQPRHGLRKDHPNDNTIIPVSASDRVRAWWATSLAGRCPQTVETSPVQVSTTGPSRRGFRPSRTPRVQRKILALDFSRFRRWTWHGDRYLGVYCAG